MAAATTARTHITNEELVRTRQLEEPEFLTLLELVAIVSATTDNEQEVVATILSLLNGGQVRLRGNFRDEPIEQFED